MTAYSATAACFNGTYQITPTANDSHATITVNGSPVTSGQSADVALSAGTNNINVLCTAEDSSTTNYSLSISYTSCTCNEWTLAVDCTRAGCEWNSGACQDPATSCDSIIDESICTGTPGCIWFGICVPDEGA